MSVASFLRSFGGVVIVGLGLMARCFVRIGPCMLWQVSVGASGVVGLTLRIRIGLLGK